MAARVVRRRLDGRLLLIVLASSLTAFGKPADVLRLNERPRPRPGRGDVLLEMLAAPVNPADLNVIEGKYGELPKLPAVIGNEGAGRVALVGANAEGFSVGDLVLPMRRGTWSQFMVAEAASAVRLPREMNAFQAAMLTVNPASAWGMLEEFVRLTKGEWIVQNAANSAVGRCVIQIARARGWRTLNLVRRQDVIEDLKSLGADAVVLEGGDLRQVATELCGTARPRLGLNAVGGASALNVANALADSGTMVTYGAMGRQALKIPNGLLIFRNLSFKGFWASRWLRTLAPAESRRMWDLLAGLSMEGKLRIPIHRVFPLSQLLAAIEEAGGEGRNGKVLLDLRA
ncbi:MAG TPA: 2-enoyl thioester reductase domain-containing protein [Terrimicrobiaceae bacterium]